MAKFHGIGSASISGKAGGNVYAKGLKGETIMRAYQPQVKNPRTYRQRVSRTKLAMASSLGAVLARVVKVGYAAAAGASRIYARNMFVKDIVPVDAGVFTISGDDVTMDITKISVAKQFGIAVKPAGQITAGAGGAMQFVPTNTADVELQAGETLGICACLISSDGKNCVYKQGLATTGVTFTADEVTAAGNGTYFAFYKAIPEAVNGVLSTTEPWMYPSSTSDSVQVFTQA